MNRAIYIWISCLCITLAAVGLCHVGILLLHVTRHYERGIDMVISLLAVAALPLFFLCFMIVCCICFLKWAVARLFNRDSTLPDFL